MKKGRCGLVGFYGHGNFGDELFRILFANAFKDWEFYTFMDHCGSVGPAKDGSLVKEFVNCCDIIIIGGGDLIRPGAAKHQYFLNEFLRRPCFIHSVGVAKWTGFNKDYVNQLKEFLSHPNIRHLSVRDQPSLVWIESQLGGRSAVSPVCHADLAFSGVYPASKESSTGIGVILRKQQAQKDLGAMYGLIAKCDREKLSCKFIVLSEEPMKSAETFVVDHFGGISEVVVPTSIEEMCSTLASCSHIISSKYHACLIGAIYGKKVLSLLKDTKFRNFFTELGFSAYMQSLDDLQENPSLFDGFLSEFSSALPSSYIKRMQRSASLGLSQLGIAINQHSSGVGVVDICPKLTDDIPYRLRVT
jgi:polysaccharide pyruvyl transferase WcaK-like protein